MLDPGIHPHRVGGLETAAGIHNIDLNESILAMASTRHFCRDIDLSAVEYAGLVRTALEAKRAAAVRGEGGDGGGGVNAKPLAGRILALLFEKPSLRTRVSFEAAMTRLGGTTIFQSNLEVGLGKRESIADVARVMSRYVDVVAIRTYSQQVIESFAHHAQCPVINALSDELHPCQALGDMVTLLEHFGRFEGLRLAFLGDGNNVARSLAYAAGYLGIHFVLGAPQDFQFSESQLADFEKHRVAGSVTQESDPRAAVADADVVYTDVWTSMGQEAERERRRQLLNPFQVNAPLLAGAKPTVRFLHCLPAYRGEEVTDKVMDGAASLVFEQAENRMHAQQALVAWLLSSR